MGKMPLYTMLQKARSAGGWTMVAQLEGDAAGSQLLLLEGRPVWQRGDSTVLLQHLILSHHGEPEFGAAVRPLCAEAELLSLIDAVDSRMEIYRETYDTMGPDTFSPRIFALEKKVFRHA